jgi:(E)-4-hydroxy-3-methylbut-2-enyl-diphosphate synthase
MKYCEAIYRTSRFPTREVRVGDVGMGGANPIRIQSMTTSNTRDVEATGVQILRLADAGCEIARVTVQGKKEAEALEGIKNFLLRRGAKIPLVADIHFYPPAALLAAEFADKVRINPGNFVDKRASFKIIEYDDAAYAAELEKIEAGFAPLIEKCKRLKRAMRIGTNHGSLSDRIMNRFGDSPRGMVESALEFTSVCRKYDYHDIIFSMKASNPAVMIAAYRLLAAEMIRLGWNYPLHLGVTEAGEGEDGRVKSAIGIGALLLDGLGDTIRVSLTEDPWAEIDPCKRLVRFQSEKMGKGIEPFVERYRDLEPQKRPVQVAAPLHPDGSVILKVDDADLLRPTFFEEIGCEVQFGRPRRTIQTADALWIDALPQNSKIVDQLAEIGIPFFVKPELKGDPEDASSLGNGFHLFRPSRSPLHETRRTVEELKASQDKTPLILAFEYDCDEADLPIRAGAEMGALLCDKLAEGICLIGKQPLAARRRLSFNLLQSARMRTVKTDFISCPGCGRTLFDLQETSRRIREKTAHLPGVKIAIMGCIVNGPGEMADADFGYVGSKPGKIDLYLGRTCVERDIDFADADQKLIDLIKINGKWTEP